MSSMSDAKHFITVHWTIFCFAYDTFWHTYFDRRWHRNVYSETPKGKKEFCCVHNTVNQDMSIFYADNFLLKCGIKGSATFCPTPVSFCHGFCDAMRWLNFIWKGINHHDAPYRKCLNFSLIKLCCRSRKINIIISRSFRAPLGSEQHFSIPGLICSLVIHWDASNISRLFQRLVCSRSHAKTNIELLMANVHVSISKVRDSFLMQTPLLIKPETSLY